MKKILVTGGCGFIGSNLVKFFVKNFPNYHIINIDKLTYASNKSFLNDIENKDNYTFIKCDINDEYKIEKIFNEYKIDSVIHLAAETHVDNSINSATNFVKTNVMGTYTLLNVAKRTWEKRKYIGNRFFYISTDEVFGSLGQYGFFKETTAINPKNPYSATKASAGHIVNSYYNTYGLPIIISNCSNNYGPNQNKEKLIPLVIDKIKNNEKIPVYGNGTNVRDWIHVSDHVNAIYTIFKWGVSGERYNIGANCEKSNIDIVKTICNIMDEKLNRKIGTSQKLISFVSDRLGHDYRYAIDSSKLKRIGWKPQIKFYDGLKDTINFYIS